MSKACYRIEPRQYILSVEKKELPDQISIDDWAPSPKQNPSFRVPSEWRALQNRRSSPLSPSRDDLHKIRAHLKNGVSRAEIQKTFGISDAMFRKIVDGALIVEREREKYLAVNPDCIDLENECERD